MEFATLTWVAWYEHSRLLELIGYVPPAEREEAYYRRRLDLRHAWDSPHDPGEVLQQCRLRGMLRSHGVLRGHRPGGPFGGRLPFPSKEVVTRRMILPLMLFVFAGCQPATMELNEQDIAAVRSLGTSYVQACLVNDADAIAALYAEDALEMPPNAPATVGSDAIRERYASMFKLLMESAEFTMTPVEIDGFNGLAFDRGTWVWAGVLPGTTEAVTDAGKYLGIARQQEDGSWLWTAMIWNSDLPLPQPE